MLITLREPIKKKKNGLKQLPYKWFILGVGIDHHTTEKHSRTSEKAL